MKLSIDSPKPVQLQGVSALCVMSFRDITSFRRAFMIKDVALAERWCQLHCGHVWTKLWLSQPYHQRPVNIPLRAMTLAQECWMLSGGQWTAVKVRSPDESTGPFVPDSPMLTLLGAIDGYMAGNSVLASFESFPVTFR